MVLDITYHCFVLVCISFELVMSLSPWPCAEVSLLVVGVDLLCFQSCNFGVRIRVPHFVAWFWHILQHHTCLMFFVVCWMK